MRRMPAFSSKAVAPGAALAFVLFQASSASAQSKDELQRQIDALKAEIQRLEEKVEAREDGAGDGAELAETAEVREADGAGDGRKSEKAPPTALEVAAEGAPSFSGEGFENFKIRGRIQSDIGQVGDPDEIGTLEDGEFVPDRGLGTTSELRRVRLGVEGEIAAWKYKFEADFADSEVSLNDAYVQYKGFDRVTLTLGNQKTPVSMEEQTSSRFTKFMERGAITDAFGFSRELGVSAEIGGENWHWRSGVFAEDGASGDDTNSGVILASRAHYTARAETGFAHIGASVEFRDSGAEESRFRQRPFLHSTDTRLVTTGDLPSRDSFFFGGELAGAYGPFNFAGEYGAVSADLATQQGQGAGAAFFQGGFLHAGYFLTGEQRGYDAGDGTWGRTTPAAPLGDGGFGAVEINAGLDWIDLEDAGEGVLGGSQASFAAGLTWIPIAHVRVLANFSHTRIEDSPTHVELGTGGTFDRDIELNTFGLRAQVDW